MEINGHHKIEISQHYLECTDGTSNKFYRTVVIANKSTNLATLICAYGPIGRAGQGKVTHGVSLDAAWREAKKKVSEKERKGYVEAKAKDVFIGSPGNLIAHEFGNDKLKDKEVLTTMGQEVGKHLLEEIMEKNGWSMPTETEEETADRLRSETEARAKAKADEEARLKAIEDARATTYSAAWGEWA